MDFISVVLLAVALAMDCFAVSMACGTQTAQYKVWPFVWLAFSMGLFQAVMPVIGWLLGEQCLSWVGTFAPWVAFGMLLLWLAAGVKLSGPSRRFAEIAVLPLCRLMVVLSSETPVTSVFR